MKKFFLMFLTMFLLVGCSSTPPTNNNVENSDNPDITDNNIMIDHEDLPGRVEPVLSEYDVYDLLPEESIRAMEEMGAYIDPANIALIDKVFPTIDLKDYNGDTFNANNLYGKKVVYMVFASWCDFCKSWTSAVMESAKTANPDVEFVQIFGDGEKAEIDEFYAGIDKEVSGTVIPASDEVNTVLYGSLGVYSFPTFIFVNEESVITMAVSGYISEEGFVKAVDLAYGETTMASLVGEELIAKLHRTYLDVKTELYDATVEKIDALKPEGVESAMYDYIVYSDLGKEILPDSITTIEGETVSLKDLESKKVLFNFVAAMDDATAYTAANNEVLKQIVADHPEYTVVNFLFQYTETTVEEWYKTTDIDFVGYSIDTNNAETLPESLYRTTLSSIPSLYFVNEEGCVAGVYPGELTLDTFEKVAELYFAETPVYINQ